MIAGMPTPHHLEDREDAENFRPEEYLPASWGEEQMDRAEDQLTRWRDGY